MERLRNDEGESGTYGGSFHFGRDVNNPFDSNYAYANALLGNFQSYTESDTRPSNEGRKSVLGWHVQNTWKANRKLTLDFGNAPKDVIRLPGANHWDLSLPSTTRSAPPWIPGRGLTLRAGR